MAEAAVGEDVHHEDPTIREFESRAAALLGKQAALFVPTGTMGNLVALKTHTQPGEEVILEERSHIYDCEVAGLSAICGLLARPVRGDDRGMLRWTDVKSRIRPRVYSRSQTRLVCLENTHNFAGGAVQPRDEAADLAREARLHGLLLHLDGARLVNASAATGLSLAALAEGFDSVMVDFAKGLGAPAGAALAGPAPWIGRARGVRKMLGGAIHQAGVLAAACLYGLDHHMPGLAGDHRNARRLADALSTMPEIRLAPAETNIVIAKLDSALDPAAFAAALQERGVLANPLEDGRLRFVTHRDVSAADIETAIGVIEEVLMAFRRG
jgi:threonine aldolase